MKKRLDVGRKGAPNLDVEAVVTSEAFARKKGLADRAVRVRAAASLASVYTDIEDGLTDFNEVTRATAALAYESAGLGPEDLDLVEIHDCFATAELLHYENLGLCARGESGALIDSGETALEGRLSDLALYPVEDPSVQRRFPPALLMSGTRDIGLSRTVYAHSLSVERGARPSSTCGRGRPTAPSRSPSSIPGCPRRGRRGR